MRATATGHAREDAVGGALLEGVRMHGRGDGCMTAVDLCCLPGVLNLDPCGEHWVKGAALNRDGLLTAPGDNSIHIFTQLNTVTKHHNVHRNN